MKTSEKLKAYARLPEMVPAWYFLILVIFQIALAWFFTPKIFVLILFAFDLVFFLIIFGSAVRAARANFASRLEKNQLQSILASIGQGIIAYDQEFRVWLLNQAAEGILGLRKEELLGKVLTPERGSDPRYQIVTQILFPSLAPVVTKRSLTYPEVTEISLSQPRELYLETTTTQIFDETGKPLGFLKVIRDRSREVQLLKSKAEFITVAAHQLRTPLSGIKWALEELSKGNLGEISAEQKTTLEDSLSATARLVKLTDDLLDVAKIEEGKFGYQFERVDIIAFIQEMLGQMEALAKEKSVRLSFYRPEETLPPLMVDRQRLSLVFQNLVENAIQYNLEKGEVRVRLELLKDRPYVQVAIEDTGIGIPEKDFPRIFSKFFRGENILRLAPEGSGLGLYIARNVIKRHGGEIWFKSVEKRGTTFYFALPTDESLIPQVEVATPESI